MTRSALISGVSAICKRQARQSTTPSCPECLSISYLGIYTNPVVSYKVEDMFVARTMELVLLGLSH